MEADEGSFGPPQYIMVIVKKGVKATADGRICEFDRKMKVVTLDENLDTKANNRPPGIENPMPTADLRHGDDMLTDLDEDEFSDVPSSRWNESSKEESDSDGGDTPDAKNLRDAFLISEDDRKDRTHAMRGFVDEARYVVYTSRRLNKMTARWRDNEKRAFISQHQEAVGKLKAIPGAKALRASSTSNADRNTLPGCMKRAQEWQNWNSNGD